jgi:hypothetical protein
MRQLFSIEIFEANGHSSELTMLRLRDMTGHLKEEELQPKFPQEPAMHTYIPRAWEGVFTLHTGCCIASDAGKIVKDLIEDAHTHSSGPLSLHSLRLGPLGSLSNPFVRG